MRRFKSIALRVVQLSVAVILLAAAYGAMWLKIGSDLHTAIIRIAKSEDGDRSEFVVPAESALPGVRSMVLIEGPYGALGLSLVRDGRLDGIWMARRVLAEDEWVVRVDYRDGSTEYELLETGGGVRYDAAGDIEVGEVVEFRFKERGPEYQPRRPREVEIVVVRARRFGSRGLFGLVSGPEVSHACWRRGGSGSSQAIVPASVAREDKREGLRR